MQINLIDNDFSPGILEGRGGQGGGKEREGIPES